MRISIMGMGYVGAVSAGCLASDGHTVVGVDPHATKVDLINQGIAPIVEKDIDEVIRNHVALGNLTATSDSVRAVHDTDMSLICVGTPSLDERKP